MANCGFGVVLIAAFCIAFLIHESTSLDCYLCNSEIGGVCGTKDKLETKDLTKRTCVSENDECNTLQELGAGFNVSKIRRDCVQKGFCDTFAKDPNVMTDCYSCNTNFCNSATSTMPSIIVVGLLGFALLKNIF